MKKILPWLVAAVLLVATSADTQNKKISELTDGSPGVSTDLVPIARGAANYSLPFDEFKGYEVVEFERTPAQMAVLFTTPYQITVADSGVVKIPRVLVAYKAAGDAYTTPSTSDLKLQSDAGVNTWAIVETTGFLDQAAAKTGFQLAPSTASGLYHFGAAQPPAHTGFFLTVTTANITAGAASPTVKFRLYYQTFETSW